MISVKPTGKYLNYENVFLFDPAVMSVYSMEIKGCSSSAALLHAVREAYANNEAMSSRIVIDKEGHGYYEAMENSGCSVSVDNRSLDKIISDEEKKPFQLSKGELVRSFIHEINGGYSLIIVAHHLAGDGKSILYFMEDIMRSLAGCSLTFRPLEICDATDCPKNSKLAFFYRVVAWEFNHKWSFVKGTYSDSDRLAVHQKFWTSKSTKTIVVNFSKAQLDAIVEKSKEIHVTVNSYLSSCFLEALPKAKRIGYAVDVRKKGVEEAGNHTSGISVNVTRFASLPFAEACQKINSAIKKRLAAPKHKYFVLRFVPLLDSNLFDSALLAVNELCQKGVSSSLAKAMHYGSDNVEDGLSISNLGVLPIPFRYQNMELRNVTFVPPIMPNGKILIGISSSFDGMRVSCHFFREEEKSLDMEVFMNRFQRLAKQNARL